jgi:hypothetical protein
MKNMPLKLAALGGLLAFSACGIQVKDNKANTTPVSSVTEFANYTGSYVGKGNALSFGVGTSCDVNLQLKQEPATFTVQALKFECADGSDWSLNSALALEMRKPSDALQLAHDLYYRGDYVGFINYSNNAVYFGLREGSSIVYLTLSQDANGVTLSNYRVVSSGRVYFDSNSTKLNKQ